MELSLFDKRLLNSLQDSFPLVSQPFSLLGEGLSQPAGEVLTRVKALVAGGFVREISGIFDGRRLGYQSTLVALALPPEELDRAAQVINEHPGVSHNYARDHIFNLWFTLALPPGQDLAGEVKALAERAGARDCLFLPALRVFKIGVRFDMLEGRAESYAFPRDGQTPARPLSWLEKRALAALQEHLPLEEAPFALLAREHHLAEEELLDFARQWQAEGLLRRYGAVLHHRKAGFQANALVCWAVPPGREEEVGRVLASFPEVSHCYQRPTYPRWPYSILSMVHGRSQEEGERLARALAAATEVGEYVIIYSTRQYKMARVKYVV